MDFRKESYYKSTPPQTQALLNKLYPPEQYPPRFSIFLKKRGGSFTSSNQPTRSWKGNTIPLFPIENLAILNIVPTNKRLEFQFFFLGFYQKQEGLSLEICQGDQVVGHWPIQEGKAMIPSLLPGQYLFQIYWDKDPCTSFILQFQAH